VNVKTLSARKKEPVQELEDGLLCGFRAVYRHSHNRSDEMHVIAIPYLDNVAVAAGILQIEDVSSGYWNYAGNFHRIIECHDGLLIHSLAAALAKNPKSITVHGVS
jgi:hypothetical protein